MSVTAPRRIKMFLSPKKKRLFGVGKRSKQNRHFEPYVSPEEEYESAEVEVECNVFLETRYSELLPATRISFLNIISASVNCDF